MRRFRQVGGASYIVRSRGRGILSAPATPGWTFNALAGSLPANITFTRASSGAYYNSAGIVTTATTNEARFDYKPITNFIRNSTGTGAVAGSPGTVPTNWILGGNGINATIVDYSNNVITVRLQGTPTAVNSVQQFETTTGIDAATGQNWVNSVSVAMVGGALTNINDIVLDIAERTAAGVGIKNGSSSDIKGSLTASLQRFEHPRLLDGGATVGKVVPRLILGLTIGNPIDITLQITSPQMEPGTVANTYVATTDAPVTIWEPRGFLREEARTNSCINSVDLTGAGWVTVSATPTLNAAVAPDGTSTATLVTTTNTNNEMYHVIGTRSSNNQAHSLYFKRGNKDWIRFSVNDGLNSDGGVMWVNLATGAKGTVSGLTTGSVLSSDVEILPNGWVRLKLAAVVNTGANTNARMRFYPVAGNGSTTRASGDTFYAWGGQMEQGATRSTSYIPASGAAATRAADLASVNDLTTIDWNAQGPGTLFVEAECQILTSANAIITTVVNGTDDVLLYELGQVSSGAQGRFRLRNNANTSQASVTTGTAGITSYSIFKMAASWETNKVNFATNGVLVAEVTLADVSTDFAAASQMRIGYNGVAGGWFTGWIRTIAYLPTPSTRDELDEMTT